MPAQLATHLAEAEYQTVVASVNAVLQPLAGFGVFSLLLPFLVLDVFTMLLLSAFDPWLVLSPWDYPASDLVLPLCLEFGVIFCSFPLMAHTINRRMGEAQRRVCEILDDTSRRFGARGISFQLKQGVFNNGAGTNLWVEVQVAPIIHVHTPCPVPVPTVFPILLPPHAHPDASVGAAGSAGAGASGAGASGAGASGAGASGAGASGAGPSGCTSASDCGGPTSAGVSANGAGGSGTPPEAAADGVAAAAAAAAASGASLSPQQVEYLRLLQENQILRQYLQQCHGLVQTLTSAPAA